MFLSAVGLFVEFALLLLGATLLPLMDATVLALPDGFAAWGAGAALVVGVLGLLASIVALVRREGASLAVVGLVMSVVAIIASFPLVMGALF